MMLIPCAECVGFVSKNPASKSKQHVPGWTLFGGEGSSGNSGGDFSDFLSFFLSPVRVTSILKGHGERIVLHKESQYFTNADSAADHWL